MSKQIALLIDNSGSMFSPVAGGATHDKIYETARGAELFISNMITELAAVTASRFAFSVHRFAQSWQVLPGCGQLDTGGPGFGTGLAAMHDAIAAIEDQASSQAAVGNLTDLYGAVRQTSDYLIANTPSFGVPDARYVLVFSDGIQTIHHAGSLDRSGYESEQGVAFSSLLADRNVRLRAWGIGSDALAAALRDLTDQAVDPTAATETLLFHPGSYTKVLFPQSEGGTFANCTTIIAGSATALVDDNGILPLRPAGRPPSGLLWEQFSLPRIDKPASAVALVRINHGDFEVDVDGSTKVLILGLVAHAPGRPSLEAVSPGGRIFVPSASGTRIVESEGAMLFKIA
ncbi:MAG TPA: hypothetical protein VNI57_07315, partial [Candidatus Saccharimonadales bacterium]|nr:hypothetical protein [Candidatus Saccharimonadales bacterium]